MFYTQTQEKYHIIVFVSVSDICTPTRLMNFLIETMEAPFLEDKNVVSLISQTHNFIYLRFYIDYMKT